MTESNIHNTHREADFEHDHHQSRLLKDVDEERNEVSDIEMIKNVDTLLSHLKMNNLELSAEHLVMVDDAIPVFNEWEDDVKDFTTGPSPE